MSGQPLKPGGTRRHGMSDTPEYAAWRAMRQRCLLPTHPAYPDYGGRGITVCERWASSFEAFYADMGPRPSPKHTLERTDNARNYEPGNCIWATWTAQLRNTRRNRIVSFRGRTMTLAEACELAGLNYDTVAFRLHKGWDEIRALNEPLWSPTKARSNRIFVDYLGKRLPLGEACRQAGLPYTVVRKRLKLVLSPETALSTPVGELKNLREF